MNRTYDSRNWYNTRITEPKPVPLTQAQKNAKQFHDVKQAIVAKCATLH
jgi:hypothetical protein